MAQNSTEEPKQEADHGAFAFQMLHRIQPAEDDKDPNKPRDVDPSDPNRSVPTKRANQAFLVHQRYLEQQKEQLRKERIAKGLDPDVEEKAEQDSSPAVIDLGVFFKRLFIGLLVWAAAGFFITGSPIWGYSGKWIRLRTYFPPPQRSFTPAELQLFSGRAPDRPIYLAVMGDVYDVSSNPRIYGPSGSYGFFSGRDASRAYITGCFDDPVQLTHDLRGLSDEDMSHVLLWKKFFDNHDTYFKVGRVILPHIDPSSPVPPPCTASKS